MSAVVCIPQLEHVLEPPSVNDEPLRRQVWSVLAGVYPQGRIVERRMDQRFPYPHLLYLTPVAADGISPEGQTVAVVGKSLSERGLGFYYQQPIVHRRMIASLEGPDKQLTGFLIELTWCRFTQFGWYESGGRFIQAVSSPVSRPAAARGASGPVVGYANGPAASGGESLASSCT
jgi:hypothetical protein